MYLHDKNLVGHQNDIPQGGIKPYVPTHPSANDH